MLPTLGIARGCSRHRVNDRHAPDPPASLMASRLTMRRFGLDLFEVATLNWTGAH
jgi:hypothetical protein